MPLSYNSVNVEIIATLSRIWWNGYDLTSYTEMMKPLNMKKLIMMKWYWHSLYIALLFQEDPMLINELRDDVRQESSKFGEVKNVKIYDVSLMKPEACKTSWIKAVNFYDAPHAK